MVNSSGDLVIIHYYVRTTYRFKLGEFKKLVITACGHRFDEMNTTRNIADVTCKACKNTIRMGKIEKY
jgi:predicted nucleic acid-binding Zn ribbon protein